LKNKATTFKFKLWIYFALFTAFIFIVLWLLQTVFLQQFYNGMLISNTKKAVEEILDKSGSTIIDKVIDKEARENTILVFVTDNDGNIVYSSDEFKQIHNELKGKPFDGFDPKKDKGQENPEPIPEEERKENSDTGSGENRSELFQDKPEEGTDGTDQYMTGNLTQLPQTFDRFREQLEASEDGTCELDLDSLYIYGTYMDYPGYDEKVMLYVSATKDAVGSSVQIIRLQLLWVTVISLAVGFILSWFIAKRFARPVDKISQKAESLGEKNYPAGNSKSFCKELDELGKTLDDTNVKLNRSREFQMELLSNVSHDLRTPLTMIKGYAEMIRDISWEDDEARNSDTRVIIKEADRLTALVNEILEYSELQTGNGGEDPDAFEMDLASVVKNTAERFEKLGQPENITVEKEIDAGIFVKGNESRIERALYNLMDNAVRHTGDGRRIKVTLHAEGSMAVIGVRDFGNGIPSNEIEHIWDRYYTSRQRKGKGVSGLGLAIVKQIVTMHGGRCYAESEEGKGCTFIIELPLLESGENE